MTDTKELTVEALPGEIVFEVERIVKLKAWRVLRDELRDEIRAWKESQQ